MDSTDQSDEEETTIPENCPGEPSSGAATCGLCAFNHGRSLWMVEKEYGRQKLKKCPILLENHEKKGGEEE